MAKVTMHPFDSPEIDAMLAGASWKILSPKEAAVLKNWLIRNSALRQAIDAQSESATRVASAEKPPED